MVESGRGKITERFFLVPFSTKHFASGGDDAAIYIWDLDKIGKLQTDAEVRNLFLCFGLSLDGIYLYTPEPVQSCVRFFCICQHARANILLEKYLSFHPPKHSPNAESG